MASTSTTRNVFHSQMGLGRKPTKRRSSRRGNSGQGYSPLFFLALLAGIGGSLGFIGVLSTMLFSI